MSPTKDIQALEEAFTRTENSSKMILFLLSFMGGGGQFRPAWGSDSESGSADPFESRYETLLHRYDVGR